MPSAPPAGRPLARCISMGARASFFLPTSACNTHKHCDCTTTISVATYGLRIIGGGYVRKIPRFLSIAGILGGNTIRPRTYKRATRICTEGSPSRGNPSWASEIQAASSKEAQVSIAL